MATDALALYLSRRGGQGEKGIGETEIETAMWRGVSWIMEHTERGLSLVPSPIGLYFAKLWYFEDLYPLIFTLSALENAKKLLRNRTP